ncbi:MAG: enoyl-CoA hydratase-related protein [Chloroflexota bacterium]|nr:enoyl-CoA hydratase-related protein [Chloroflexota bacterium]
MAYEQILYETRGAVGLITLNRPEKLNAWTPKMMAEMRDAIAKANEDEGVGAIVVTGAGRAFCAGADISNWKRRIDEGDAGGQRDDAPADAEDWVGFLLRMPKPTIAAINGAAVGVGITQVLPMDIRIASENAQIGMFFVRMGLVPELASSYLLPQLVGFGRAMEWCLTGRMISAQEALAAGLVSEVVPPERLLERALELGELLAKQPRSAIQLIRTLLHENAVDGDYRRVMEREGKALAFAYTTPEHKEAVNAFMEKRAPDFAAARRQG